MRVAEEDSDPTLWLSVPDGASGEDAVLVLLPEHVTVRRRGTSEAQHLYLWQPGKHGARPHWARTGDTLQYESDLGATMHFLVRAYLQADGVLLHYEFMNNSDVDFDSVQAVTDPRMVSPLFRDVRLERTYVHEQGRFALLASDMPQRVNKPISEWLPNRYRISYSWPVERELIQKQSDGITFFNAQAGLTNHSSPPPPWTPSGSWRPSRGIRAICGRTQTLRANTPTRIFCFPATEVVSPRKRYCCFRGTLEDVLSKIKVQRGDLK